tara:strand:- start:2174 stop:2740 length:567 start_codon:yes stop_codon:yes gene_type:complete
VTRYLIRFLHLPGIFFLLLLGTTIQGSLFMNSSFGHLKPEINLLAVIWFALHRNWLEGGILTLFVGRLVEIHSGAPQGLFLTSYMAVFLMTRLIDRVLLIPNQKALFTYIFFLTLFFKISQLTVLGLLNSATYHWKNMLTWSIPQGIIQVCLAYWIFPLLEKFDWKTYKDPRSRQALEDELRLDEEGF